MKDSISSSNMTRSALLDTLGYYNTHAADYCASTVHLDLQDLYEPFFAKLVPGACVLDAGCGSGRDTKAFLNMGYRVTAIDESREMARLATAYTELPCEILRFQDMDFRETFDGIWACASLLHIPKRQMNNVMVRFVRALKTCGIFYISLKEGEGERIAADGRLFNYYTVNSFRKILAQNQTLYETAFWKTEEIRSTTHRQPWLNFLLRKGAGERKRAETTVAR
jgi:SAM-dependent methyltransferase